MIKKIFGLFIVCLGILVLLSNVELLKFDDYIGYLFSLFVIVVGIVGMYERKKFDVFYSFLILLGISVFLSNLGVLERDLLGILLAPAILILIGIKIITNSLLIKRESNSKSYTSIFGGIDEKNTDKNFTGCEVTAVFGGGTIDFRGIKLKEDKAYINVTTIFGGSELIFSKDYKITVNGTPIFGGLDNKLLDNNEDAKKEIIINYIVVFGGIEIRN